MSNSGEDEYKKSRRSIDYFNAEKWARVDERLRHAENQSMDAYEEIFGGKGKVGMAEQMRSMLKIWGAVIAIASLLLGSWTWIYDKVANKPLFGDELHEKWKKESEKRVRLFNKDKGAWEYYYMLEEVKTRAVEDNK